MTWDEHPAVRTGEDLTLGERAADRVRNSMGSWPFVFGFLTIMGIWAAVNSVLSFGGPGGFDPYPYILLNLMLSMIAGLQGAILLIAAKRADHISSEVALHTFENTQRIGEILARIDTLTTEVHHHITTTS